MGTSVQLLLRSAADKVRRSLLELEVKSDGEQARNKDRTPQTLTNATVGVRALKSTFAKPKPTR